MKKVKFTVHLANCSIYELKEFFDMINSMEADSMADYASEVKDSVMTLSEEVIEDKK